MKKSVSKKPFFDELKIVNLMLKLMIIKLISERKGKQQFGFNENNYFGCCLNSGQQ